MRYIMQLNTIEDLRHHGDLALLLLKIRMTLTYKKVEGFIVHADEDKISFIPEGEYHPTLCKKELAPSGYEWDEGRDVLEICVNCEENYEGCEPTLPYNKLAEVLCGGKFYGDVAFGK